MIGSYKCYSDELASLDGVLVVGEELVTAVPSCLGGSNRISCNDR